MKETTKEMLVRKFTSRKFWLSVASFVTMVMVACGASEASATQVTGIIMAGATVLAYVLAEGFTDAGNTAGGDTGIAYGIPIKNEEVKEMGEIDLNEKLDMENADVKIQEEVELDGQEFDLEGTNVGEKMFADGKEVPVGDEFDLAGTDVGPDEIELDGQEFDLAGTDVK